MSKAKKSPKPHAAAKKAAPPPPPKAKAKAKAKAGPRSMKMAETPNQSTVDPARPVVQNDPNAAPEPDPTGESPDQSNPLPDTPMVAGQAATYPNPALPQTASSMNPPPDLNPPTGPVPIAANTLLPPQPYSGAYDAAPIDPPPDAPRSYAVAAGPTGPILVTGTKTADQLKAELENLSDAQKKELAQHSTGAGPGTGSTLDDDTNPYVQQEKNLPKTDDANAANPDGKQQPEGQAEVE